MSGRNRLYIKRILCAAIAAVTLAACTGCSSDELSETYNEIYVETTDGIFTTIKEGDGYDVVYENETMIMYIKSGRPGYCSFTLLVNADGTPRIYEGENDNG